MYDLNTQKGFTMLEALIYIALFAFIIGTGVIAAYNLFTGSVHIQTRAQQEAELNFVLRKLEWALGGSQIVNPAVGDDALLIAEKPAGGTQYHFKKDGTNAFVMRAGGIGTFTPLTTKHLNITNIRFERITGAHDTLTIDIEIDGKPIEPITKYVRTN